MVDIETPFPVEATITPKEYGYGANLPCASEWLTETEHGDKLQAAVDRARSEYGNETEVEVVFYGDGHGQCKEFSLIRPE